jgi:hypothetical protein
MPNQSPAPQASNSKPETTKLTPVLTKPRSPSQANQRRANWL